MLFLKTVFMSTITVHMNAFGIAAPSDTTSLARLKPGQSATIVALDGEAGTARRMLSLGFVPGSTVTVRRTAPLRDPIEFFVRGTFVSIRRAEAANIVIRPNGL